MFRENRRHLQHALLENTQWMHPRILEKLKKSWAPIFYEEVFKRINEEPFAVLYDTIGKPNFPVNILLSLEYIKSIKDCNDLELIDSFHFDYLVNYAVGMRALGDINLADRTLYYFRERVYQHILENPGAEDLLFGQFLNLLHNFAEKAKIVLDMQRTDTTMFTANIKKAGRLALAYDVLVKAVKEIPDGKCPESLSQVLLPGFKTDTLYRSKAQEGEARLTQLLNLCRDALTILESLPGGSESETAGIVRRFLNEQAIIVDESGKLAPKSKKEISPNSLQSAHDPDATYRKKGVVGQSGYVGEITETCNKLNPFQLITDYAVHPNTLADSTILQSRLPVIHENTGCTDMYVDGGFHSEGIHQAAEENDVRVHLTGMSGTEPQMKLPVTRFQFAESNPVILQCPAGHVPLRAGIHHTQTVAHFSHEACRNCEFQQQCYSRWQRKDCVVRISLKAVKAAQYREDIQTHIKENTSLRAAIEGSNSAVKRTGLNDIQVRGLIKTRKVFGYLMAAQNIKRFIRFMQGGYKPKQSKPSPGILVPNCS